MHHILFSGPSAETLADHHIRKPQHWAIRECECVHITELGFVAYISFTDVSGLSVILVPRLILEQLY